MKIDILTLFPKMFDGFLSESIIKRAIEKSLVEINIINFRDYSPYKNKQVDDYAFGGGAGMILMCEPIFNAVNALKTDDSYVIITSPRGNTYNQKKANILKNKKHIILVCGHYEGFDERIYSLADEIISVGNYVLTGGEIPSMAITDSIVRLLPGVINEESLVSESFNDEYYDYPVYTKPRVYNDLEVPEVLLSGNHKLINEYRETERKKINNKD